MKRLIILSGTLFFFILSSCQSKEMTTISLDNWQFRQAGQDEWQAATIPGCVHTDLLALNKIPDPFYRQNEKAVMWVEKADWEYKTTFEVKGSDLKSDHISLQFDGLDTYADVYVNDSLVLKADNMFIGWNIPVKNVVKSGRNELRIYFHSAVTVGMEKLRKVPYTLMAANELAPENERTNVFTRKAPFHYGWDWGPRLVTCGIWRPVKLEMWNTAKLDDIYIKPQKVTPEEARYSVMATILADEAATVSLAATIDGKEATSRKKVGLKAGENTIPLEISIQKPELWWTNGLGGHKLYTVEITLSQGDTRLGSIRQRLGVRTLELVQQPDSAGSTFYFKLNGVPVFMKGSNYIPSDIFLTRNTKANFERVVKDARDAGMNMLRVWGGGVYEDDALYDLMDENGILAWNDFMFACNVQPVDSLHLDNIRKEAEYNVKRLRNHPSIALWCGNNENLSAWFSWNWKGRYPKKVSDTLWWGYQQIYHHILPDAVSKYHPEVSYWPSSPQTKDNKLSDRLSGDEHDWSIWFANAPFSNYAVKVPRFVSEYGMQSFPEMKTIKAFAKDSDMAYRSPVIEHRQRSNLGWIGPGVNGNEMILIYIKKYYKEPKDFASYVYLSQVMQAESFRAAIEAHRRNMPYCMGSLYWQINDCWPTMSWSSVDYFGRWKASQYFVAKAFYPLLVVPYANGNTVSISVVNDHLTDDKGKLELTVYDFSGKELWKEQHDVIVKANSSQVYARVPVTKLRSLGKENEIVLQASLTCRQVIITNYYYLKDSKDLALQKPLIEKTITKHSNQEAGIRLHSNTLVKNLALTTSAEGRFSDNYFDVIPGRDYYIIFNGDVNSLEKDLAIQCVNESF
jgi:beta-mannosidase